MIETTQAQQIARQSSDWQTINFIPHHAGVYKIIVLDAVELVGGYQAQPGEVVYVGQSLNLRIRLQAGTHHILKYLDSLNCTPMIEVCRVDDERTRLFDEASLIGRYRPHLQFGNLPDEFGHKSKPVRLETQPKPKPIIKAPEPLTPQERLEILHQWVIDVRGGETSTRSAQQSCPKQLRGKRVDEFRAMFRTLAKQGMGTYRDEVYRVLSAP
jgi:hypothetical protein